MSTQRLRYCSLKLLSIWGLLLATFTLPYLLPGPPLSLYESRFDDSNQRQHLIATYGFDRSLPVQYAIWTQRLVTGQWGLSRLYHRPVFGDIVQATGFTLLHLLWTAIACGVWTAVFKAVYRILQCLGISPPARERLIFLDTLPSFFVALILHDVAVWQLGWIDLVNVALFDPAYYRKPLIMLIPASALALTPLIVWHTSEPRRTVPAKTMGWRRFSPQWARFGQRFRPLLGYFLMEVLLTEYVFSLPGLGSFGINALRRRDFPLLQGFILGTGGLYMILLTVFDRWTQNGHKTHTSWSPRLDNPPVPDGFRHVVQRTIWGLIVLFVLAIWAPHLFPYDPTEIHAHDQLLLPNARYVLGTDFLGRDVLSRTIQGFRSSIPRIFLTTVLIIGMSGLLVGLARFLPRALHRLWTAIVALLEAFPPFLLAFMVFLVVEHYRWPLETTLIIACLPVACTLPIWQGSRSHRIIAVASIGELVLLLEVIFFYLRLSPEPITPTWGGDIRIGAQYSHMNIWALLAPVIAVAWSRSVFHQLSCLWRAPGPYVVTRHDVSERD